MKKTKLFKSLLVAAGLLVGASAWADVTLVYGRALADDATTGATAWSSSDVGTGAWGGNASFNGSATNDYEKGIYISGTGNRTTSNSFTFTKNAIVTLDIVWNVGDSNGSSTDETSLSLGSDIKFYTHTQDQSGKVNINGTDYTITNACGKNNGNRTNDNWTIHAEINTLTDVLTALTVVGRDGTNKASFTLTNEINLNTSISTSLTVTMATVRSKGTPHTGLQAIVVKEEIQEVETANYTINYKVGDAVVKTVSASSAVGAAITADIAVDGEGDYAGKHYVIVADAAPSITLAAGENVLDVPVRVPYAATLKVTTTINGTASEESFALTETDTKDCSYSYAYSKYVKSGDVYYVCDATTFAFNGTFTDGEVIEKAVTYTNADENIVFFAEAESVAGKDENCSWGGGGHVGAQNARDRGVSVGTLPAGTYMFEVNILGDNRRSLVLRQSTNDPMASVGTSNEDHSTGLKSAFFTLTAETENLLINGANSGEVKTNQSEDYDYVVIRKISSMSIVGDFSENGWVTESGIEMTQDAENPAIWTAVVENFEVTSDKLNYEYKAVANGKYGIYDLPASGNQNYGFGYDGAGVGFYNLTFTVNTTANTVELAIEKQKQSFTVSYVNTENKAKLYAYTFNAEELGGWPGTEMDKSTEQVNGFDVYTITFEAYNAPEKIVFSDNAGWQTENLDFVNNSQYGIAWPELTIGDAGYRTYCSPFALDFSEVEGLTAYRATISGTNVSFVEVTEVPANEGILLKGAANTYTVKPIAKAEAIENIFVGTVTGTTAPAGSFVLMAGTANNAGTGFYQTKSDFTVGANTAYIPAAEGGARSFIAIDGEATAIEGIATEKAQDGVIYNLQGQRVVKAQKGLYIIDGKKVMVK